MAEELDIPTPCQLGYLGQEVDLGAELIVYPGRWVFVHEVVYKSAEPTRLL